MTGALRNWEQVKSGLADSVPIVMGYIPACITFGLVGKTLSLGNWEVFLLSALVYAGASQFIGAKLLAAGTAAPVVLLLTLVVNLRYFFIGMSFRQKLDAGAKRWHRALVGFGLTEEVYAIGMMSKANRSRGASLPLPYLIALELPPYAVTLLATWIGIVVAGYVPAQYLGALNTSLYALLIALIVPQLLGSRRNAAICLSAALASWLLQDVLGSATVLAAMFIGAGVGVIIPQAGAGSAPSGRASAANTDNGRSEAH
ncbi:AzlC family ABC transporter permease [Paenibacillus aurantiacus]|uniref:AzlC family ABC transporter permease n=1 Tax=Paenibacillus aurantiacus TaxID=1936118 RepID=A0ABV5KPP3_9BACL